MNEVQQAMSRELTLPEIANEVMTARKNYEAIRSQGAELRRMETAALNTLNQAQRKLLAAFSNFAKAQPSDSDLYREYLKTAAPSMKINSPKPPSDKRTS